ncbi:MAG: hypothetical protein KIT80_16450 [Chitinophagaceae bacterium]|nr:hypothetical protein [Chitinophagaceae bacterium]MCW5928509.1 hypothetical protein [Chitinophagaceae bacterium]
MPFNKFLSTVIGLFLLTGFVQSQTITLKNAVIAVSDKVPQPMQGTVKEVLQEEIRKRTGLSISSAASLPSKGTPVIAVTLLSETNFLGRKIPAIQNRELSGKAEGFSIVTEQTERGPIVWIIGADKRGVLFGAGWLLRHLKIENKTLQLSHPVNISSAPDYAFRGHQLGYRNTANSYDAWTVEQYEEYIRELAIFGSNAVEGIPMVKKKESPHFKISPELMDIKLSEICRKYDMDYWMWTPVTFDLTDLVKRKEEIDRHEQLYKSCPRIDHIFVPGGDPGHNHPSEVLPFLKDLYPVLTKYHPKASIWVSLQGFDFEKIDYFFQYLKTEKPAWLAGVVTGPGSPPLAETRFQLPKQYKHRHYPDITHSVRCEFPVANWDQAYALTLGREAVNPRPYAMAKIHASTAPFTDGFVSYSDGNHDDLNKVIWSMRAWDASKDPLEILQEYSRFFFGSKVENDAADGIAALENNWKGPLVENGGVEATLSYWKRLEKESPALTQNSWRWQMLLLRAYYDTYIRRRLVYEESLEKQANEVLLRTTSQNIRSTMEAALTLMNKTDKEPVSPDIKQRIEQLCEDLFRTTGLQTSVPKYKARGYERGAVLDFVDYPLNNRWWLADEFKRIEAMENKEEQVKQLHIIANWENPGPGSYYDDISSVSKGPRVKTTSYDATDIAWWDNGSSRKRLSFQTFQRSPRLEYSNLEPGARYIIRTCGFGEALLRVDGVRLIPHVYNKEADTFKEWVVPATLTNDGHISVSFDEPEESHLNWRMNSRISDIWLIKQ